MATLDLISVTLTQREAQLLLCYGYPFEREETQLRSFEGRTGFHVLKVSSFYLSHLIADLIYSARKIRSDPLLLEELDELCGALESAESRVIHGPIGGRQ
jgi:hypothetical protein